ncbi:hypothetical protein B0H98_106149 [Vreelandella songnenensis]|uniref:Uncharacterized protein n=1 Tax=Vreelandella songnenensis TaxID=1176243 RepID=A0A2T0V287_9GAMM|nr:hypothetical protein [Halomonas songnenensis]PRY64237.1 hypothetical protein B0H98_106149 [Halomonas songnenensis]
MKKEALKKLGILGVSFGLMASPLAFAQVEGGAEQEPMPQEEPMQDEQGNFNSYDTTQDQDQGVTTEYEEEEQEFTYEEEEEEQEYEPAETDSDDSQW